MATTQFRLLRLQLLPFDLRIDVGSMAIPINRFLDGVVTEPIGRAD